MIVAIYQRGAGQHVAERVQPEPGSPEEQRLAELVARGEGGWQRVEDEAPAIEPGPQDPPGGGGEGSGSGPDASTRPARSATKAEWAVYARTLAQDADEVDNIDGMTKEQLVERYGGEA